MSVEQFLRDLGAGYRKHNPAPLNKEYLAQLFTIYGEVFVAHPPTTIEQYGLFLAASLQGLTDFTRSLHPALLQQPAPNPLFHTAHRAEEFLDFEQHSTLSSFLALARPFSAHPQQFPWLINVYRDSPLQGYEPPRPSDFKNARGVHDERRYERALREYNKHYEKLLKALPPLQSALVNSPLYHYAHRLLPTQELSLPFDIPPLYWFRGTWCVAAPDRGKTNLLRYLILHHSLDASVIVLDAKGDLRRSFERLAPIKDRLVIIEPNLDHPPALNPLDMGPNSAEFLGYLFSLLEAEMTSNQETLFYMVGLLLNKMPGATIRTFRDIIAHGWQAFPAAVEAVKELHPDEQTFFYDEFDAYKDRRPEILIRLRRLMTNPYIRAMLTAPKNRLNLSELMDQGKIILINNSYNPDQLGEQGAEFFGRLIIAMVWAAARRRQPRPLDRKRPVFFVLDEAHIVIARDRTIKTIINQCRSQRIAMIFAHQEVIDIKDPEAKSALAGCGIKFANSTGEAYELAPRLHCEPDFINQPQGTFACEVVDQPPTVAVAVPHVRTNPDYSLADFPVIGEHEFHALISTMRARYCWTPDGESRPQPAPGTEPAGTGDGDLHWTITVNPGKARGGGTQRLRLPHIGKTVVITIPPDSHEGRVVRLKGCGSFKRDGTRGDLFLKLYTEPGARSKKADGPGNPRIGFGPADRREDKRPDAEAW